MHIDDFKSLKIINLCKVQNHEILKYFYMYSTLSARSTVHNSLSPIKRITPLLFQSP